MASLMELRSLFGDSDLQEKVEAALIITANDLLQAAPTADDQKWAAHAFSETRSEGLRALKAVLASNSTATVAQIQAATDAAIQSNVDSVRPALVVAFNAGV